MTVLNELGATQTGRELNGTACSFVLHLVISIVKCCPYCYSVVVVFGNSGRGHPMDKEHLITVNVNNKTTCVLYKCISWLYYIYLYFCAAGLKTKASVL